MGFNFVVVPVLLSFGAFFFFWIIDKKDAMEEHTKNLMKSR